MLNRFLLLLILSVNNVLATDTTTNSLHWLTQMQASIKTLNYQGTVVFLKNNTLDSMKYFHAANEGIEQEHLLSLNSPVREILRNADNVSCLFKDLKKIEINHLPTHRSFIINLPKNFNKQTAYYDFELGEQAQVAMLPTQVILVKPKDEFRYARKIWIDKHHKLPLKTEVYDPSGVIIEQVMFTELKVKKSLPFASLNLNAAHLKIKHIHQADLQALEKAIFTVNNVPQGFKEVFFIQMQMHGSKQSVEHLLLSDGFSSVSIYQETQDKTIPLEIQSAGSVNSLVKRIGNFQFVVMGDVPVKTIQFIVDGISLKDR